MFIFVLFILILNNVLSLMIDTSVFIGDKCVIEPSKNVGECTYLMDCESVLEGLQQTPKIIPQHCRFDKQEIVVCCPKVDASNEVISKLSKAEEKCEEYSKQLRDLLPKGISSLIIRGKNAKQGEYPHMAALGYGPYDDIKWLCGGSLISDRFILTAAHCLDSSFGEVNYVRLGDVDLNGTSYQDFKVQKRIQHPEYKIPNVYNDIALLELEKPVVFTPYIKPACLYTNPNLESVKNHTLEATGWGSIGNNSKVTILQKVQLKLYEFESCLEKFGRTLGYPRGILEENQICVGGDRKDTCSGDSGGPYQLYLFNKRLYSVVGVTSFGKGCGVEGMPAIYTKVSYYVPWIEKLVWMT